MTPAFDRGQIPKRILTGLSKDGPAPLHRIYGLCGATDGGQQFFVRQELKQLTADCKVRRDAGDLYVVTKPVAFEPDPDPEPPPETAADQDDHRPAAAETVSAPEATPIETGTQPAQEETETMQTQTTGSNGHASAKKGTTAPGRAKPLKDFIVTLLTGSDAPMSIEAVAKAAMKKGVTTSKGSVSVTLQNLARERVIAKPETGMYAGAEVVYDATKAKSGKNPDRPKRTAEDVKKAVTAKKAAAVEKKASAKTKPRKAASKPGRKPSPLAALYAQVDAKIERNRKADDEACAGIREIDGKIAALQKKRVELVGMRDAARENVKKSRDGRKRIAELEAGVVGILKD